MSRFTLEQLEEFRAAKTREERIEALVAMGLAKRDRAAPDFYHSCLDMCSEAMQKELEKCEGLSGDALYKCGEKMAAKFEKCFDGCDKMLK